MPIGPVSPESHPPAEVVSDPVQDLEIRLLLQGVYERYGYDFRDYALSSQRRRIRQGLRDEGLATVSALQDRILHDSSAVERLVTALSVSVTSLFRHPGFYRAFRERAAPILRTYPVVRVWHAGCATGEEVYSMAILLREESLYERAQIYATDVNAAALRQATEGTVAVGTLREASSCYVLGGGRARLAEYYTVLGARAAFDPALRKNVVFAEHNLATDRSFNEFHVIICRNVMIYFGRDLQRHVHELFLDSLVPLGLLGLGRKEAIGPPEIAQRYDALDATEKLFRRRR